MLLNTIVKTVKRKAHRGSQSITTDQITTDIIACANEAIRDIQKLLPKRYWYKIGTPLSLVSGAISTPAVYSLASDVQEPSMFYYNADGSVYRLTKIVSDREWIDNVWNISTGLNRPRFYREIGNNVSGNKQIEIFPIPDQSYTLFNEYYKLKGVDLTTSDLDTEIPDIPDSVQDAIEKGALYYFLLGFDDPTAEQKLRDYEKAKIAMDIADEQDIDSDLKLRWNMKGKYNIPPHFTLD